MSILVLGDGILGKEVVKQTGWDYISRKMDGIDITDPASYMTFLDNHKMVFNCIGATDTYSSDRENHWAVNYLAVMDLVDVCNSLGTKLIHMSTDYLYDGSVDHASEDDVPVHPQNWYSYTKLLGDAYVQGRSNDYLLIRASFKESPFVAPKGWMIKGNFDYVEEIVERCLGLIDNHCSGLYNVGTETKTMYDLARQTRPRIGPTNEYPYDSVPENITMNTAKMERDLKWPK